MDLDGPRISRLRHEPRCLVPFIASRALALTNLDWDEQWEIFHHPRRARQHHNFQLRAIVDALYAMIQEVPLEPRRPEQVGLSESFVSYKILRFKTPSCTGQLQLKPFEFFPCNKEDFLETKEWADMILRRLYGHSRWMW